ncbi:MAG: efflux RND transporter periplasmic adaptor subunit [Pseudomonadota bacterium]
MPATVMIQKFLFPAVIVVACAGLAVWLVMQKPAPAQRRPEPPVLLVEALPVSLQTVNLSVRAQGTVTPRTETTIVSEVSGQIVEVSPAFVAGGFFKSGETLVRIDDRNYRADLKRAQAAVASARTIVTREQGLADYAAADWAKLQKSEPPTPLALREPQLAEARANLQSALADLERKQGDLDRTIIRAPYNGMVREKRADLGQYVGAGSQLGVMFSVEVAEIRLPLPDRELPFLDLEQNPAVLIRASIGGTQFSWRGQIVRTEGVFDERSRVLYAVAEVLDPYNQTGDRWSYPLRIGTFVDVTIEGTQVQKVAVLPRTVLRQGNRVWTIGIDHKLEPREVTVLRTDETSAYISHGLDEGDLVCLTMLENPLPGTVVRYSESEAIGDN